MCTYSCWLFVPVQCHRVHIVCSVRSRFPNNQCQKWHGEYHLPQTAHRVAYTVLRVLRTFWFLGCVNLTALEPPTLSRCARICDVVASLVQALCKPVCKPVCKPCAGNPYVSPTMKTRRSSLVEPAYCRWYPCAASPTCHGFPCPSSGLVPGPLPVGSLVFL